MKKLVASVGLVALGASGLQTAYAQATAQDTSKNWSVSATLRGFYDDNFNTLPNSQPLYGYSRETFGWEITPSLAYGLNLENTVLAAGFTYSYKYFENNFYLSSDKNSQDYTFYVTLNHAFSERYRVSVNDSFVIGQEPDMLRSGNTFSTFQRIEGNNIRNYGVINFDADITRQIGVQVGYNNGYYNYEDSGDGSYSALLDRLDNAFHIDGKWMINPQTTGILGYQYAWTDFTSDYNLTDPPSFEPNGDPLTSDTRNTRSHYIYVGGDHTFNPSLQGSFRAGARFTDFPNDPNDQNGTTPYAKISAKYNYTPDSYAEIGFAYDRTATDLVGLVGDNFTTDADTATVFGSIVHQLTPKLVGSLLGQFQNSSYNGGLYDGETENFFLVGVNLEYRFTKNLSASAGYNYDKLNSHLTDNNRSYDRNRVYIGVTAAY